MKMPENATLVVSTTNRPNALSTTVATYCKGLLTAMGVVTEQLNLTELPADFTVEALYAKKGSHQGFNKLGAKMDAFSKYLFVVPQYNGSFPGVFKAFIDGYANPNIFKGKKAALVGVSKGFQGGIMGLSHLTDILMYLGMTVYPMQPKLSNMPDTTLATLEAHPHYLALLKEQAVGFSAF